MMKNKIILFLMIMMLFSSCTDYLDVQPVSQQIPETIEDYALLMKDWYARKTYMYPVYMTDDIYKPENKNSWRVWELNAFLWKDMILPPDATDYDWQQQYNTIMISNVVLEDIDNAEGNDETWRKLVKGEALAWRAMKHFYLVNEFAKHYNPATASGDLGVPLVLKVDLTSRPSRATVEDVYNQILIDLNEALELLPNRPRGDLPEYNNHPSKAGVYGLLSRVYLYMGEWEKAKEAGENCLAIYNVLLDYNTIDAINDPQNFWGTWGWGANQMRTRSEGNKKEETIWHTELQDPLNATFLKSSAFYSDELVALYEATPGEIRYNAYVYYTGGLPKYPCASMNWFVSNGPTTSEVMLNVAEANVRLGNATEALDIINNTMAPTRYNPAEFVPFTPTNDQEALQIVKDERRKELAFRGLRLFDMKRYTLLGEYNKTLTRTFEGITYTLEPNSPRYVLPISILLMELNPNIEPNP